jgi:hypothetical protein
VGLFLTIFEFMIALVLEGVWRRRFRFVPTSIHYATAWWPPVASVLCFISLIYGLSRNQHLLLLAFATGLFGVVLWGFWLWASASESQHIPFVLPKLALMTLVFSVLAVVLMAFIPGSVQTTINSILSHGKSGLTRVNLFGTFAADPIRRGPATYALVIDRLTSGDEGLILHRITQLGAEAGTRVEIRGDQCTLQQIKDALSALKRDLRSDDSLILYINGHGAEHGAGSIRMVDGEITTQMLSDFLSSLPTSDVLLVIDSCFGGKFITALRGECNAVVLASTDKDNLAFKSGLRQFWDAWGRVEFDADGDGRVAINEAFWLKYRSVLEEGESRRQAALILLGEDYPAYKRRLNQSGYTTPQLEALGKAKEDRFAIPVTDKDNAGPPE